MMPIFKDKEIKIVSKEQAFWENEIRLSQMQINSIQQEMENGEKMIKIYENTIEFCKKMLSKIIS